MTRERLRAKWRRHWHGIQACPVMVRCCRCGMEAALQRHHPNRERVRWVRVVCQTCHTELHMRRHDWGIDGMLETSR